MRTKGPRFQEALDGAFFPAVPVPFDEAGQVSWEDHDRYTAYMREQPISGVATWAHTGRGLHLEPEVADEILRRWRAALPERFVIAGAGAAANRDATPAALIERAAAMAKRAAAGGADALLAFPPRFLKDAPERQALVVDYHKALAASGLPLVAFYLYEAAGGLGYTQAELDKILDLDAVVALKMATLDSVCTFQNVARQLDAWRAKPRQRRVTLLSGEDRFLGYSLLCGASGALVGLGAAFCELQHRLVVTCRNEDYGGAITYLRQVDELAECTFVEPMEGYIERMLYALSLLGVIEPRAVNDPWGPGTSEEEKARIRAVVEQLTAESS